MGMSRRGFLKGMATAGMGLAVAGCVRRAGPPAAGTTDQAVAVQVAKVKELRPWEPITFEYPGKGEKALLIDVGVAVDGGVGPNRSIVAFSALCQHMGCPLDYDARKRLLVCPCHASAFDPRKLGRAVEGPSTRGLPVISLTVAEDGTISATGVRSGIVYGRVSNL